MHHLDGDFKKMLGIYVNIWGNCCNENYVNYFIILVHTAFLLHFILTFISGNNKNSTTINMKVKMSPYVIVIYSECRITDMLKLQLIN